jgi:hypothetical protein
MVINKESISKGIKKAYNNLKYYFIVFFPLWLMITLIQRYGSKGFGTFALILIGYVIIRMIQGRKLLMYQLRKVESAIWGKPLDRKEWEKDEFKNTKVVVHWKKEKEVKNGNKGKTKSNKKV